MSSPLQEPTVARAVGISKARLVAFRKNSLEREVDWRLEGAVVTYTAGGLEKLLAGLGLAADAFKPAVFEEAVFARRGPESEQIEAIGGGGEATEMAEEGAGNGYGAEIQRAVIETVDRVAARVAVELRVVRQARNPRIVLATTPQTPGVELRVVVRENRNFLPGMTLRAKPADDTADTTLYYLDGRCPRWRGRW